MALPLSAGRELIRRGSCSSFTLDRATVTDYWTPSEEQLDQVEVILYGELTRRLREHPRGAGTAMHIHRFHRQHVGVIVGGRRVIYVNAFVFQNDRVDWRRDPVSICDGGLGVFSSAIDIGSGRVLGFGFNGFG